MSTFAYHPDRPGIVCIAGDPPLELQRDLVWGYTIPDVDAPITHRVARAVEAMPMELVRRFLQDMRDHLQKRTAGGVPDDLHVVDPAAVSHWLPILEELDITADAPYPLGHLRYALEIVNGPEYRALKSLYDRLREVFPIAMVEVCRSVASFRNFRTLICDLAGANADKTEALMLLGSELAQLSPEEMAGVCNAMLAAGVTEETVARCIARLHPAAEETLQRLHAESLARLVA